MSKYTHHPEAPYNERGEFREHCSNCKKEHIVYTQQDEYPEYVTVVFVKCDCGHKVKFCLPVN